MASGTRVPVDTSESVSSCAWCFLGRDGVSRENEDKEAESQCRSEKYASDAGGVPSPSAPASSSAGWLCLRSVGGAASASVRLLPIDGGDPLLALSASVLTRLPPI